MITRSQAIDYYTPIQAVTDNGKVIFNYDMSYFIASEVIGAKQVSGEPVKGHIKYEYDIGRPERMRGGKLKLKDIKRAFKSKKQNYLYIAKQDILNLFDGFPLRQLKKCIVEVISINGRGIVQLVEDKKILREFDIKLKLFKNAHFVSVSDFRIKLNAYMLQKIVFYGFKDYGRIGLKFDDSSDVVLFHHSKEDGRVFWILPDIPVSLIDV